MAASPSYLDRHAFTEDDRATAVGWMDQVSEACSMGHGTLPLAVSYFDRYLSCTEVRECKRHGMKNTTLAFFVGLACCQ